MHSSLYSVCRSKVRAFIPKNRERMGVSELSKVDFRAKPCHVILYLSSLPRFWTCKMDNPIFQYVVGLLFEYVTGVFVCFLFLCFLLIIDTVNFLLDYKGSSRSEIDPWRLILTYQRSHAGWGNLRARCLMCLHSCLNIILESHIK